MPADPKTISRPWRRYLRFSVRGLIVLVLLIGAGLGWTVRSARIQSRVRDTHNSVQAPVRSQPPEFRLQRKRGRLALPFWWLQLPLNSVSDGNVGVRNSRALCLADWPAATMVP
jgi:hypothetical protein